MTIARIDHSGRRTIAAKNVGLELRDVTEPLSVVLERLDLGEYDFPEDADVRMEALRRRTMTSMTFDLGKMGADRDFPRSFPLAPFGDSADGVCFRIVVSCPSGRDQGRIFGDTGDLSAPRTSGEVESLLPVLPDGELGNEVWRLSFDQDDGFVLKVNSQLRNWKSAVQTDEFVALVYPQVFRDVLQTVLASDGDEEWRSGWRALADDLAKQQPDESNEAQQERVIRAFCRKHDLLRRFERSEPESEGA